jgi:hypothetical protein
MGIRPVSRSRPCPVCNGNHKCALSSDGLVLCGRRSGPQPGFACLGPAKRNPMWCLYRAADDPAVVARERFRPPPPKPAPRAVVAFAVITERFRRNLTPALADELCKQLGLPRVALDALPGIGYSNAEACWTFPEQDGAGQIIGIVRRARDGSKRAVPGSRRGLTVPVNWRERETPLILVEGASDVLALSVCGVSSLGRPSNCGGTDLLATLLADFPRDRDIIVLGEHDAKPDGSWPGRDGATRVAVELADRLSRPVFWGLPPDGSKDIRAWLTSRKPAPDTLDAWHELGEQLVGSPSSNLTDPHSTGETPF